MHHTINSKLSIFFDDAGDRLVNAVMRAGNDSNILRNPVCDSPVLASQAGEGAFIIKECQPPVLARYVSVDLKNGSPRNRLTICEVMVDEYRADRLNPIYGKYCCYTLFYVH